MGSDFRAWMLPEGVVEYLPTDAATLNRLEQVALSTFAHWGYQPLRPPMLEYIDTFVEVNPQGDLLEQTLQFKDQKTGKQLAIRADITPQIARIDAHYLRTQQIARYAYVGEVVKSLPTGHGRHRNPSVAGVELFGSNHIEADSEIISLLIDYLHEIALRDFVMSLGNVDVPVELLRALHVPESLYGGFFQAWSRKDGAALNDLAKQCRLSNQQTQCLTQLIDLHGGANILATAREIYAEYPSVLAELDKLQQISAALRVRHPTLQLHIDLSDVHGYGYHNGIIFAAYVNGLWQSIARGGRYNGVGDGFDCSYQNRPATGFSCNLNLLTRVVPRQPATQRVICCDLPDSPTLNQYVSQLRKTDIVIQVFADGVLSNQRCTHKIITQDRDEFAVVECSY
ncbi:ATP phosphoribosyltransferase regulatory subunit [Ostreibacterium oceani]|uniref:ATP phosphoribosyltransferase regulatory subunit n=1 Tax=Ostreibacterium oceani TaxID=2654998 RepID=A0A6N7EV59_9GAMM|nr:ATP phosphoribosyltransferase regulatory subunit [Ostreibacterium oceani]MPV85495.1 hypothetical protein [Ostreibacterium oceani]